MQKNSAEKISLLCITAVCFIYWTFLFFNTEMFISQDAFVFQECAKDMYEGGIKGYLEGGLSREPLYPFMIAVSMELAEQLSLPYDRIQAFFQLGLLFFTQVILFYILTLLKINWKVKHAVAFYFGVSPAMINAALSLYSEILAMPFAALIILSSYFSWKAFQEDNNKAIALSVILTIFSFFGAVFVKAIFQYIGVIYLFVFSGLAVFILRKKNKNVFKKIIIYFCVILSVMLGAVNYYRLLNLKYNGHFDFTNRYDELLFGNTGKRTEKMDKKQFLAHIASVPGENFCLIFFDKEACDYCTFKYADHYRTKRMDPSVLKLPASTRGQTVLKMTKEKLLEMPLQYTVLTFFEALKMAFWESTKVGYVQYPPLMEKLYNSAFFKNLLRLAVSLLTYVSILYGFIFVILNFRKINGAQKSSEAERVFILFFVLLMISVFTSLYALFSILTRFAFPVVSLYMICIACLLQGLFFDKKT